MIGSLGVMCGAGLGPRSRFALEIAGIQAHLSFQQGEAMSERACYSAWRRHCANGRAQEQIEAMERSLTKNRAELR